MALPCAAERQPARDTDQRQIGRQARVLEDALLKQVLEIGRVGHEQGAVKNRAVLLGFAVEQIPVPAERVDGTRILQQRQPRREQQHAPAGTAQSCLPRQAHELAQAQLIPPPGGHAEEIDDKKDRLPGEEEVVIDKVQRDPERERTLFIVDDRVVQRGQHVRKQRHNVQKVVEKDVVDAEPGKRIQAARQHAPGLVPHPAARPEIPAAARNGHFQAEQRHHGPRHEPRGHDYGQPEERTAQQVERVGIDKSAAQVGGPAERPAVFDKGVGVLVKVDLLVVEVPRVVEVPAARDGIHDAVGRKQQHRREKAECKDAPIVRFLFKKCGLHIDSPLYGASL